jgi:hypothetical protein
MLSTVIRKEKDQLHPEFDVHRKSPGILLTMQILIQWVWSKAQDCTGVSNMGGPRITV